MERAFSPGIPVAADAAVIERKLSELWESVSQQEDRGDLIRACAGNFVALADNQGEAVRLLGVLPGIARQHPLRSLLAYREETQQAAGVNEGAPIRAWIDAQCSFPVAGGPQVCSEVITLAAADTGVSAVTNLLAAILIPDLPVYIYLPVFTPELGSIVSRLAAWTNLLILDSTASGYRAADGTRLTSFLSSPPAGVSVRDLEWARLTSWRDLVSQFFDSPDRRSMPYDICRVEISASHPASTATSSAALLLVGWLASRLNWLPLSAESDSGCTRARFTGSIGEILVRIESAAVQAGRLPRIESLSLRTRAGGTFAVTLDRPSCCLAAESTVGSPADARHTVPDEELGEADLLVRELAIAGDDPGFQKALNLAIPIVNMLP